MRVEMVVGEVRSCMFWMSLEFLEGSWVGSPENKGSLVKRRRMYSCLRSRRGGCRRWDGTFRLPGMTGKVRRRRCEHQGSGRDWNIWI